MPSTTKFRDELAHFPAIGFARREHLERWANDDRLEEVWEKLEAAVPTLNEQELIGVVLRVRQDALSLVDRLDRIQAERDYWLPIYASELDYTRDLMLSANKTPAQIASHLEKIAASLRRFENPSYIPDDLEPSAQGT